MGPVRITSWYPDFNGSHFGLLPSSIHSMTGLTTSCELWLIHITGHCIQNLMEASLPHSSLHRLTGLVGNFGLTLTYSYRPHCHSVPEEDPKIMVKTLINQTSARLNWRTEPTRSLLLETILHNSWPTLTVRRSICPRLVAQAGDG